MAGEVNQIVDRLTLEYRGVFSSRELFRMFTKWYKESPYEKGGDYISEQNTSHGKCIEYTYMPWIKPNDYIRNFMRIRILIYDMKKVDIMVDGIKEKMDEGRILIFIDGFLEYDYDARWGGKPMLQLMRTFYIKFMYKYYSKFFEGGMINDCHALYELFERFFNMYKTYRPIKKVPHFYY